MWAETQMKESLLIMCSLDQYTMSLQTEICVCIHYKTLAFSLIAQQHEKTSFFPSHPHTLPLLRNNHTYTWPTILYGAVNQWFQNKKDVKEMLGEFHQLAFRMLPTAKAHWCPLKVVPYRRSSCCQNKPFIEDRWGFSAWCWSIKTQ